jgi:hypothetical protein
MNARIDGSPPNCGNPGRGDWPSREREIAAYREAVRAGFASPPEPVRIPFFLAARTPYQRAMALRKLEELGVQTKGSR